MAASDTKDIKDETMIKNTQVEIYQEPDGSIYVSGELLRTATVSKMEKVQAEGSRKVNR